VGIHYENESEKALRSEISLLFLLRSVIRVQCKERWAKFGVVAIFVNALEADDDSMFLLYPYQTYSSPASV
jgi:hypothetical protein